MEAEGELPSEKKTPPSDTNAELRHEESTALVGRYVEVEYRSRGTLKGLVTGYYRETKLFRIDYTSNAARLRSDSGILLDQTLFHSEEFSTFCTIHFYEEIQDSISAAKYFDPRLIHFPVKQGKVGYMLGKIVKSDWGNDGVFLGILVDYKTGQKFKVMYMDGDDEWGKFVNMESFELEDGGKREISWFDLCPKKLEASGNMQHQKSTVLKQPVHKPKMETDEREIRRATSTLLDEIFEKLLITQDQLKEEDEVPVRGAFSAAFLKSSGMDLVDISAAPQPPVQRPSKKIIKKAISKRSLEGTEASAIKKLQKSEKQSRPKRHRERVNGVAESFPATKKMKQKLQKEEKNTSANHAQQPVWLSEQTTTISIPGGLTAEPAGPETTVVNETHSRSDVIKSSNEPQQPMNKKIKVTKGASLSSKKIQPDKDTRDRNESNCPSLPPKVAVSDNDCSPHITAAIEASTTVAASNRMPTVTVDEQKEQSHATCVSVTSPPAITSPSVCKPANYSSVEIGFEMQEFEKHLENLTQSRERIANATSTAISLADHGGAKRAIQAVLVQMKEPVGAERKVALFYLLDSILRYAQKDRNRAPLGRSTGDTIVFLDLVESHLKEIVETLSSEYDSYTKLEKVLELWKEGSIFTAESMDTALGWLHAKSGRHARFIEDDHLREAGRVPYYVRSPDGPECHRVVLSRIFATVGKLSDYLTVPEALSNKQLETIDKSAWEEIDREIDEQIKALGRRRVGQKAAMHGYESDGQPEEGEIPSQPPLPSDSPPMDVDDPNFVAPLPSDDDDPSFVPPLPTSPPPVPCPGRFRNIHSLEGCRRHYPNGEFPNDRSLSYRERTGRGEHRPEYSRPRSTEERLAHMHFPSPDREYGKEWHRGNKYPSRRYRQEDFQQGMYPPHQPYHPHPRPMHHLPPAVGNAAYPYPPHPWAHGRPHHHHPESYQMWNSQRRHW